MVWRALRTVFGHLRYVCLSVVVGLIVSVLTILWTNLSFLTHAWLSDVTSWRYAGAVTWELLVGTPISMGWLAIGLIVVTAGLLGMLTSMIWYAWRQKQTAGAWRQLSSSTGGGMLAALLGIGCVACGPLLVGSLLSVVGAAGVLTLLPLHGAELSFIAIALLSYALYAVSRVITQPPLCAG